MLEILTAIFGISCIILSIALIIAALIDNDFWLRVTSISLAVSFVLCLIFSIWDGIKNPTPKEYSSSKYDLTYKYIIEDNQADTIYVIKKK